MGRSGYNVAVVGATGAVGEKIRNILEERSFPVSEIRYMASSRSKGKKLPWRQRQIEVEDLSESDFKGVDIAVFSAGGSRSKKHGPRAAREGAVVVDNSSAFRMDENVPLVVPEINANEIKNHRGIIANPNCSTIQMVMALKPIYERAGIVRVVVTTFQSVSGSGSKAIEELKKQSMDILQGRKPQCEMFPYPIAFECIPQIPSSDAFGPNSYTSEEMKLLNETRKIIGDKKINVTMTAVRVPVFVSHCESVNVQTQKPLSPEEARDLLSDFPGVKVLDDPSKQLYPLAAMAEGKDEVFVGRIRKDESIKNGLNMWVVSDNLRKGAALNAVQIAEKLIEENLID
ncbi:MAG: aspartate-semialdehyde dehydrogenase [Elusimicrobiota bacterium]